VTILAGERHVRGRGESVLHPGGIGYVELEWLCLVPRALRSARQFRIAQVEDWMQARLLADMQYVAHLPLCLTPGPAV